MKLTVSSFVSFFMILALGLTNFLTSASAKTLTLYDEPSVAGNIIETLDSASGVIFIYSPKDGKWVKVANPKNGNVGWIMSSDLKKSGSSQTIFAYASSDDANKTKQSETFIMHFGQPQKLTPEQAQAMIKKIKMERESVNQSRQHMVNDMNHLFQEEWKLFNQAYFPVIVPILMQPAQKNAKVSATPANQQKVIKAGTPAAMENVTGNNATISKKYSD